MMNLLEEEKENLSNQHHQPRGSIGGSAHGAISSTNMNL